MHVILTALLVLTCPAATEASAKVPLPRPRPAEAGPPAGLPSGQALPLDKETSAPGPDEKPSGPPELSACRRALTDSIAIAPSIPPIRGPGGCGGEDLVRLEAIVVSPGSKVVLKPSAILRCPMAAAVADWIRTDMVPMAAQLGTTISELDNFDSYECRGRNRVRGAKLSEHGLANALDIRSLTFANGNMLALTDRLVPRELREKVLASVCSRFTTVLGPGSDWYHEDHVHLDLAQRRNNFRLCQWGVYDPLPVVAPLLPAERPEQAPPRRMAEKPSGEHLDDEDASSSPEPDAVPAQADEKAGKAPLKPAVPTHPPLRRSPVR